LAYNDLREEIGLPRLRTYGELTSDVNTQLRLATAYPSIDDVDAWVGIIAEDPFPGAVVGELAGNIVARAFANLRCGDRLFYTEILPPSILRDVQATTMRNILSRNTDIRERELQ